MPISGGVIILVINDNSGTPIYKQIYNQLREQMITGQLKEGTRLTATRNLAKSLNISRNTVESAYQQLCSEGYVTSKIGSGYIVNKVESVIFTNKNKKELSSISSNEYPRTIHDQGTENIGMYNFQYGRLDINDFPLKLWKRLTCQVLASNKIENLTAYTERKGELDLRIEIMKYLINSRGVLCQPDQIILSTGSLASLLLLCQLLRGHSTDIAVEEPGFDAAREVFTNSGFNIKPVEVEEDGIKVSELEKTNAKLLYITPSHQYPMGSVLSINKRYRILEWANKNDAIIIEDDYDSELRYNSRPIPSMQSSDTNERVVYISTFSKSLAPGLRISFMVLPPNLIRRYNTYFAKYNCVVPWIEQAVLYKFMSEGHWDNHLRKICQANKKKHDILVRAINDTFRNQVKIYGKNAGLHIVLQVKNGLTEKQLIEKAKEAEVIVYPMSRYWNKIEKYSDNMVILGFSSLSETKIPEGIKLLKEAWGM